MQGGHGVDLAAPPCEAQGRASAPEAVQDQGPCGPDTEEEKEPGTSDLTMAPAARLPAAGPAQEARGGARPERFDFGADPAPGRSSGGGGR